jgi:hypothetical protein
MKRVADQVPIFPMARGKQADIERRKQIGLVKPALTAGVAELVDAPDLGSGGESRGGSSPSARTISLATAYNAQLTIGRSASIGHSRLPAAMTTRRNARCR